MFDAVGFALVVAGAAVVPFSRHAPNDAGNYDADLVARALRGQRVAQHGLYVRFHDRVRTRALRLLGRSADSEIDDIVQDSFVAAFRDLVQLADPTRFGSWVCGIAAHQVHRRLRRRQLLRRLGFERTHDEGGLAESVDPGADPELVFQLKQLDAVVGRLSPRPRVAWVLRYVEGCSLEEVAEQCGVSLATAKRDIAGAERLLSDWLSNPVARTHG